MNKVSVHRFFASLRMTTLVLLALTWFSACIRISVPEKTGDDEWTALKGDRPVSFNSTLSAPATKALLPNNTAFGVFSFYHPGTVESPGSWDSSGKNPDFMFNQRVYYNGSTYAYSPTRFWPSEGNKLSFWAYCPYSSSSVFKASNGTTYSRTSSGVPDMSFTVTDGRTDLLSTDLMKNVTRPVNNTVSLNLRHRLSKISVNICKEDPDSRYTVTLKSIRFDGIYKTANLRTNSWRNFSNRDSFSIYTDDPADDTDDIELTTSMQAIRDVMLIPQDLNYEYAKLHVEYTISYSGILHERTNAWEVLLSDVFTADSSTWTRNKRYTLNLTVQPDDPIEFTVSWSDWGDDYNYHITS